ncbi:hypothetical protein LB559_09405 [Mesorhizobium sp. BR1-1-3]|uniref:hypothetical protein n=1 Tax=Mesorhizobium sp. BR1-1-3 TaxID=2876651 RepID=UPI001CD0B91D|nr:hypothetical protein [Mesorhizobium sp. BR1-1-3]MBZ9888155.1 hypothetical protein [Mesorhizobium sp. BR1-1-3]
MIEADEIIDRYRKAYEAANGKPAEKVEYRKGWFVWSGRFGMRKRKADMVYMTGTLLWRASGGYA